MDRVADPERSRLSWWQEWSRTDWVIAAAMVLAGIVLQAMLTAWLWRVVVLLVFVAYPGRVWWRRRSEVRRNSARPPQGRYTPPPPSPTS